MPIYSFVNKRTGAIGEFPYSMKDAPPLDSEVQHDGETWVRVVSPVNAAGNGFQGDWGYPARCPQLNPNIPEGGRDKFGMVVVRSPQERRTICSKYGYEWD